MCLKTTPQYNLVEQFSIKKKKKKRNKEQHTTLNTDFKQ